MKWIGQHIYDLISRFRNDVYLEDISTGTIASGAHLGLDSNNKIVKAADGGGDLTGIVAGTGLSGDDLSGPIPTLNVDAAQPTITTLAGLTSFGVAGVTTNIVAGDLTMYNAVDGGNPGFSIGANSGDRFVTTAVYNSGAQTLDSVNFQTFTTSGDTNDGRFIFSVDEVELLRILDTGITSSGIGSFKGGITATNETASSATEGGKLILQADDGAVMADNHRLGVIEFSGAEDASATRSIGARIQAICRDAWDGSNNDADLEFYTTDGTTESKVLTLDADKLATFAGGVTVTGTITGNVTGDLTGEADTVATIAGLAPNTATTQATQAAITTCANLVTVGTIGTGVWNATAIASAKMATGTASAQGALELATTGEADTGTDTARAVTPAGLKSHVDTRYAYSYMTWSASATSSMDGSDPEWKFPNTAKGIYEEDFTKDENIKATSVGATTFTTTRQTAVNALVIPHTGVCVGFHAHGRNDDSDASFKAGLFHYDGSTTSATNATGIDYGATGATHECTLRWIATANEAEASGGTDGTGGAHSFKGPCKLVSNVTNTFAVTAGDALLPAIMGPDASDEIFITMSIILKIPLA